MVSAEGFFEDASLSLLNRNFFFSQGFRHGDRTTNSQTGERKRHRSEWAHGWMARFESGYTPGLIGFGLDLHGLYGMKLSGGDGRVGDGNGGPGLVPRYGPTRAGRPKDNYGRLDYTLKMRFRNTELRYGDVRPDSPVLHTSDIRLLPQSFRGLLLQDRSLKGLGLQFGKLTSQADRTASAHRNDLGTAYGGLFAEAEDFVYAGLDYQFGNSLKLRLHHGRLDNIWTQSALYADWKQPLSPDLTLIGNLRYYRTEDSGSALLGRFRNQSWSTQIGLEAGAQRFIIARTQIGNDAPFDYVWHTWDFFLNTNSQVSDFNNPNEKIWLFRYDYDFAALGLPGLTLTTRYVRGRDIDGSGVASGYSRWKQIRDGRHWERNFWLSYVVQSGPARNLSVNVLQATHRVGGDHTAESNVDELRIVIEYPFDLSP